VLTFLVFCWYCFRIGSGIESSVCAWMMWILGAIVVVDIGAVCLVLRVVVVALGVGIGTCCCLYWEHLFSRYRLQCQFIFLEAHSTFC